MTTLWLDPGRIIRFARCAKSHLKEKNITLPENVFLVMKNHAVPTSANIGQNIIQNKMYSGRPVKIETQEQISKRQCLEGLSHCYRIINRLDQEAELGIITWKKRDKELSPIFDKIRYYKHLLDTPID